MSSLRYRNGKTGQLLITVSKLFPYFPTTDPMTKAANPNARKRGRFYFLNMGDED